MGRSRTAAAPARPAPPRARTGRERVRVTTLASGLRVATDTMPGAHSVGVGAWVQVGARDESADQAGVSHFLEHLLFKGTRTRTRREIDAAADRVGGELNAFTTKEYTAFYARLPAAHLAMGLEVIADVLTDPLLRSADVETERHVILEELALDDEAPEDRAHTYAYEALFPGHALGRETAGTRETVAALSPRAVRAFFRRWYRPGNLVVAASGPVDHDDVVDLVRRCVPGADIADGAGGAVRPVRRPPLLPPDHGVRVLRRSGEQAHVVLAWPGLAVGDADRDALEVANHVLGGSMTSRLFEEVREQRGLAYSVFSSTAAYADAGSLTVYAATSPEQLPELLAVLDGEVTRIVRDGVTDDELEMARGSLAGGYLLGLEGTGARMGRLGGQLSSLGRVVPVAEQVGRIEAVTGDDVRRALARVLGAPRVTSVVGPVAKRTVTAALAR